MMMSKINCEIIKDLLPLYTDKACSKETMDAVEEHIHNCPVCEAELIKLQSVPDISSSVDEDIDKAVKNANKKIKKGKKKVAIRTICIALCIAMLSGVFIFFQYPLNLEKDYFCNSGLKAVSQHETWKIENTKKFNYENTLVKCYIDTKHGKYEETEHQDGFVLTWDEKKFIVFNDTRTGENFYSDTSFNDYCKQINDSIDSWYYPAFILKKGVKELGYQTELSPMYDSKLIIELIKMEPPETTLFLNFNDYSKACAYYYLHQFGLPVADKFIVGESKNNVMWGTINIRENFDVYVLYYQPYDNTQKETMAYICGFTKEEAQEIAKSIVIK